MAWGKNQNWKWQLRDSKGRWIEMGRGVKWYSPSLGREVSGTVVGQKGKNAIVNLTSEPNNAKTGKPQQVSVKGSDIEVIANKATLNPTADKAISATDEMLKQGQRTAGPTAGPKAIVNKVSAPAVADVESQLDELEDVTVQADEGALKGDALKKALDDASFTVPGEKGDYKVSAGKDENKEWNFLVSDDKGAGLENIPMGVDDTKDVVGKIGKAVKAHEKTLGESEESDSEAAAPKDTNYNENGLTDEEQKLSDGYVRMAERAEKSGNYDAADRYRAQKSALDKTGEDRKAAPDTEPKAEVPETAPEAPQEAPKAVETPEAAPVTEAGTRRTDLSAWKDMLGDVTAEVGKPEHEKAGNRITAAIQKLNGMDGNPTVVSDRAKFDALPGRKVYRGVATQEQADQFMDGPNWVGEGGAGSGIYASTLKGRGAAFKRANGGALLEMNIPEDARIADGLALEAERKADLEKAIAEGDSVGQFLAEGDLGRYATARGYDGFEFEPLADKYDDDEKFVVLTNRSAVSVFGEPAETGTGTDDSAPEESSPSDTNAGTDKSGTAAEGVETPEAPEEPAGAEALPEFEPVEMPLPRGAFKTADRIAKGDRLLTMTNPNNGKEVVAHPTDTNVAKGDKVSLTGKSAEVTSAEKIMGTNKSSQGKVVGTKVGVKYSDGTTDSFDLYANRGGSSTKGGVLVDSPEFRAEYIDKAPEGAQPEASEGVKAGPVAKPEPVVAESVEDKLKAAGVTRTEPVALPGEKFAPTRQQQDIIDSVMAGKNTAVQALAGSGKTSTLEALAKRIQAQFPEKKIAYIAFNRSVKLEAEGRMPSNVESKTQHGLAYGWAPKWMKDRSNDTGSLRRGDDVAGFLGIRETIRPKDGEPMSVKEQALAAMRTVDTFANSAEDVPDASHMPEKIKAMGPEVEAAVLASAAKIWEDLQKPDGKMRFSLDHMRKQWALTKPDLSKQGTGLTRAADIIFMDEAQDTPKVMAALMDHQTAQKVVVGDSNQNIYSSFTGSIDYMSQVEKDIELPLTKSWRFGPAVADIGNRFLQLAESPHRVEGGGESSIVEGMQEPDAILVRSNAGMLGEILAELEKGRTVGVPSGTKKDMMSLVDSAAFLKGQGDAPSKMHDDLAAYRSWDEVVAEAEAGNATMAKVANMVNTHGIGGLRNILNQVVEKGGDGLAGMVLKGTSNPNVSVADGKTFGNNNADYLKQAGFKFGEIPGAEPMKSGKNKGKPRKGWIATGDEDTRRAMFKKAQELASGEAVDVTISTAHKSKGLEWDKVKIGDDFRGPKLNEETGETEMPSAEELRVAYVAVTRAAKELDPGSLGYVFDHTDENGGIPKPAETAEQDNAKDDERPLPGAPDDPEAPSDEDVNEPAPEVEEPAPAPEAGEPAPVEEPTPAPEEETPEGEAPVANEEPVPEEEQEPEPEPDEVVDAGDPLPEPAPLPVKEEPEVEPEVEEPTPTPEPAPAPSPEPEPAPEPTPAPADEEAPEPEPAGPTGGRTELPTPDSRPVHPVKLKAAQYPDGTIVRSARKSEAYEKTGGKWHMQGDKNTPVDPMDWDSPFVYDMPKQDADSFDAFEGIDSAEIGDIIITRKGTQAAVVGKRDGKLIVAAHNQTDEQRRLRPALSQIDPTIVKGINKFAGAPAAPARPSKPRTPFSGNRGNSNVTIKDVAGNEIKIGDTVRTDMGTGKVVRVRPSDGPSGSAFIEFPDGTIKSFRSGKMRNTAFAEEVTGGDDPSKMEIGSMGEAGDGRAFMVGKGNKPIFKGDNVALADGTTGKVSGFAKGVQSVNIRVEGRKADIRKKASVVDAVDYNAPETTTSENDTTPASAPAPLAPPEPVSDRGEFEASDKPVSQQFVKTLAENNLTPELFSQVVRKAGTTFIDPMTGEDALQRILSGEGTPKEILRAGKIMQMVAGSLKISADYNPKATRAQKAMADALDTSIWLFTHGLENKWLEGLNRVRSDAPAAPLKGDALKNYSGDVDFSGFDFATSRFNPISPAGLASNDPEDIVPGTQIRPGVRVADKDGNIVGIVSATVTGSNMVTVTTGTTKIKRGADNPARSLDASELTPVDAPWDTSTDLTFDDVSSVEEVADRMSASYPGVAFGFEGIDVKSAQAVATAMSKLLNKYPMLRQNMVSISTGDGYDELAYVQHAPSAFPDPSYSPNRMVYNFNGHNANYDLAVDITKQGIDTGFQVPTPDGLEIASTVIHEMGHALDNLTGRMTEDILYDIVNEVWGGETDRISNIGDKLHARKQLSRYSTINGKLNVPELVAEAFADVELNGANAYDLSKHIHAALISRLQAVDGPSAAAANVAAPASAFALADEMQASFSQGGFTYTGELPGGNSGAAILKGTLPNGMEVVMKTQGGAGNTDKEYLASRVLNTLGVNNIGTVIVNPNTTMTNFVRGKSGLEWMNESDFNTPAEMRDAMIPLKNSREVGLFDFITSNQDRHAGNWLLAEDGSVAPIDHGGTYYKAWSPKKDGRYLFAEGKFAQSTLGVTMDKDTFITGVDASVSWTRAELEEVRAKVEGLASDYADHPDWHQFMLDRLDYLMEGTPWQ